MRFLNILKSTLISLSRNALQYYELFIKYTNPLIKKLILTIF